jgi:hypothetical protein
MQHLVVVAAIATERIVDCVKVRKQLRQAGRELRSGMRDVGAVELHRALHAGARAVPCLALWVTGPREQHEAGVTSPGEYEHALWLVEPR